MPILALGFVALVAAALGGLARLGLPPTGPAAGITWHGALMVSAFFGTVIALERAVALGQAWTYAGPIGNGLGGIALLAGATPLGLDLFIIGAAALFAASALGWWRQRSLHAAVLVSGALALVAADVALRAGAAIVAVVPAWLAFFVLTIGGERLELSRLVPVPPWARAIFAALAVAMLVTALAAVAMLPMTLQVAGVLMVACAGWLVRYDIATRTVRGAGVTRYIACSLLIGYGWLAVGAGVLAWTAGRAVSWPSWDLALHAILIGFVFSMVFGHAPVILPAVLQVTFRYSPVVYAPLVALHLTLALRVAADLVGDASLRAIAGAGNVASIALFIATAATLTVAGTRARRRSQRPV